jgi:hypothetical protein
MKRSDTIRQVIALLAIWPALVFAQSIREVIPAAEPNCAIETPPAAAGIAATPGGFVMVYPRNDALPKQYTGCKSMWLVDGERLRRMATLYFKVGELVTAAAHNIRDVSGGLDGACAYPEGKSLLPNAGRQIKDAGCGGFAGEPFYRLHLPTWPRNCLTDQKAAICQQDPR